MPQMDPVEAFCILKEGIMFTILKRVTAFIALLSFLACSNSDESNSKEDPSGGFEEDQGWEFGLEGKKDIRSLRFLHANGEPLFGARVKIGYQFDSQGKKHLLDEMITDENGYAAIPKSWMTQQPLTVFSSSTILTTVHHVLPEAQEFFVDPKQNDVDTQVSGVTSGYGQLKKDGKVDFSMVIPTLNKKDLIHFDMSRFVSNQTDRLDLPMGRKMDVPSNVVFPKQKEKYFFFTITFDKPLYRSYLRFFGSQNFVALHGQFELSKVADAGSGGGNLFDMINYFNFLSGGHKSMQIVGDTPNQNIAIDQWQLNQSVAVTAPKYPGNQIMVLASMLEKEGEFYPTDIKTVESGDQGEVKLANIPGFQPQYLAILKQKDNLILKDADLHKAIRNLKQSHGGLSLNQMSLNIDTIESLSAHPRFLPLVEAPIVQNSEIRLTPPGLMPGVRPLQTLLVYAKIEQFEINGQTTERKTRLWVHEVNGWVDSIRLPDVSLPQEPNTQYRWEVIFTGGDDESTQNISQVKYITKNAVDL